MKIAAQFVPANQIFVNTTTRIASSTFNGTLRPGKGKLLIINNSTIDLIFTFTPSADSDYVPALTTRLFELDLPWWGGLTWTSAAPIPGVIHTATKTAQSLCTVIAYENSEHVPDILPASSYVNPNSALLAANRDVQFTNFSGTSTTSFGVGTSTSTGNMPIYIQKIVININPTNASTDKAHFALTDSAGNQYCDLQINNTSLYTVDLDFSPAIIFQSGTVTLTGQLSSVAGSGVSNPCFIVSFFFYC